MSTKSALRPRYLKLHAVLVFAFLFLLMLIVLGGTSRASELDPNETVTGTVDPVVETVTDTVELAGRAGAACTHNPA